MAAGRAGKDQGKMHNAKIPVDKGSNGVSRAVKNLSRAIQFKTVSLQDEALIEKDAFRDFHAFLEESYPLVHRHLEREVVGDFSLLYTWKGSNQEVKPVVLAAHMDVVPVSEATWNDWTHPPFEGRIEDGFVWGRGTMDCKGILIGIMEAVEGLLEQGVVPHRTVYLAFGEDEEVGGYRGAAGIASLLESRGVEAEYVLDEGGFVVDGKVLGIKRPVASIGVAEKGYLTVELTAKAPGGHAALPPASTAIGVLASSIHRLERNPFPARIKQVHRMMFQHLKPGLPLLKRLVLAGGSLLDGPITFLLSRTRATDALIRTTMASTIIHGGTKENVLPQEARALVNLRTLPGDFSEEAVRRIRRIVKDPWVSVDIKGRPVEASGVSGTDSQGYRILENTIRDLFPEALPVPVLLLGMSDARHYTRISDAIYRFSPLRVSSEDQERGHGTDERVQVDNYREFVDFYSLVIRYSS